MQKKKDQDKEPENSESREMWLDDASLIELSRPAVEKEKDDDEKASENKE